MIGRLVELWRASRRRHRMLAMRRRAPGRYLVESRPPLNFDDQLGGYPERAR